MVHEGQGLPLGLKAGDHLFGIHAQLEDFEGHAAANRFHLLGHINNATTALPDLLEEFVTANVIARFFNRCHRPGQSRPTRRLPFRSRSV